MIWTKIDSWSHTEDYAQDRDRVVFKTKNNKLMITNRFVDEWLIEKYGLTHFIILPL